VFLKPGGIYFLQFHNPFTQTVDEEGWDGQAYQLKYPYLDGEDLTTHFPHWDVDGPEGSSIRLESPHEFTHTLSTLLNSLVQKGFTFLGLWEWIRPDSDPEPGSWAHFTQVAPPYLSTFWRLMGEID
jgi:hypothetical protein